MGPFSLLTLKALGTDDDPDRQATESRPPRGMTLLQVQSLNNLRMGTIRPVRANILGLRRGVEGYGRNLYKVYFHPWRLRSILNAHHVCEEVARTEYGFDLLFVSHTPAGNRVEVLCPRCHRYWQWVEGAPNNLRTFDGRLCPACAGSEYVPT